LCSCYSPPRTFHFREHPVALPLPDVLSIFLTLPCTMSFGLSKKRFSPNVAHVPSWSYHAFIPPVLVVWDDVPPCSLQAVRMTTELALIRFFRLLGFVPRLHGFFLRFQIFWLPPPQLPPRFFFFFFTKFGLSSFSGDSFVGCVLTALMFFSPNFPNWLRAFLWVFYNITPFLVCWFLVVPPKVLRL